MMEYEIHELSNLIPEMDDETFQKLKADVRGLGVIEPVILYEGKILDGRARYRAAQELFIDCPVKQYTGNNPVALLLALNVFRQHLTPEQSAEAKERLKEPFMKNVQFRPKQENLFSL